MTLLALLLLLGSAAAHSTWNYLAKASGDKTTFTWCFVALAAVIYLPVAVGVGIVQPMPPQGWLYAGGTALLHVAYFSLLGAAYARADLSVVYPVSRGTGIALVPIVAVVALGERVSAAGAAAIAVIVAGVLVAHTHGLGRAALGKTLSAVRSRGSLLALLTGLVITTYSTWDKLGVGIVNPLLYGYFVFLGPGLFGVTRLLARRKAAAAEIRRNRRGIVAAAILAPLAYFLVLFALTFSPVSYIAPAREIGIVVGAILGATVLKEPNARYRLLGSGVIVAGIAGLALFG
jgi:drug/metabolite transporter (DMT)-like permease